MDRKNDESPLAPAAGAPPDAIDVQSVQVEEGVLPVQPVEGVHFTRCEGHFLYRL